MIENISPDVYAALADYLPEAQGYICCMKAANTVKAYRSDWVDFEAFCQNRGEPSLPAAPETVAAYAADKAGHLRANTVERKLAAISQAHQLAGFPNPTEGTLVRTVMAGIRRVKGTVKRAKEPTTPEVLQKMFESAPDNLRGLRDRALLLIGFAGAFRRSELVALQYEDVRFVDAGLSITISQSKAAHAAGEKIEIPFGSHPQSCPVRALKTWLVHSKIDHGYLFTAIGRWGDEATDTPIGGHQVAKIIKHLAARAGFDSKSYSTNSLRAGFVVSAAKAEEAMKVHTRNRSVKQIRKYKILDDPIVQIPTTGK